VSDGGRRAVDGGNGRQPLRHRRRARFFERTTERIEQRRTGRLQDEDLDLPRRTVSLEEMDGAVAHHWRVDAGLLSAHGRRVGSVKSVAVDLAAQRADLSGRAIGEHEGICANAS